MHHGSRAMTSSPQNNIFSQSYELKTYYFSFNLTLSNKLKFYPDQITRHGPVQKRTVNLLRKLESQPPTIPNLQQIQQASHNALHLRPVRCIRSLGRHHRCVIRHRCLLRHLSCICRLLRRTDCAPRQPSRRPCLHPSSIIPCHLRSRPRHRSHLLVRAGRHRNRRRRTRRRSAREQRRRWAARQFPTARHHRPRNRHCPQRGSLHARDTLLRAAHGLCTVASNEERWHDHDQ